VVLGPKRTETRSWNTTYRGPLLIHAGQKTQHPSQLAALERPEIRNLMDELGFRSIHDMPLGKIIGGCELAASYQFTADNTPLGRDRLLGNFTPGRFGLCLEDPWTLPVYVEHRGYPSLWRPTDRAARAVLDLLASSPAGPERAVRQRALHALGGGIAH
jgi:hypothetical protein